MRARESGEKRPCELCGVKTLFQSEIVGPKGGHIRWADTCCRCGEQTALTATLAKKAA